MLTGQVGTIRIEQCSQIQPTVVDFLKDTFPESGTCCRLMEDALTLLWLDENC